MIRASTEEVVVLLTDWKERGIQIGACLFLREDGKEEHRFWGKVVDAPEGEIGLSGEYAFISFPFDPAAICEYSEISEAPEHLRERFPGFDFCLTIRSQSVFALLFGAKPKPK